MKIRSIYLSLIVCLAMFVPIDVQAQPLAKPYQLWYNQPAPELPITSMDSLNTNGLVEATPLDPAWENWSLPIGNGYLGASIFGRTVTERIQLTENSMAAKSLYNGVGLTSFGEMYIDFKHTSPLKYKRTLDIGKAVSTVSYQQDGVNYERTYFASFPDKVLVIRLTASKKGKLSFTLRPEIPYKKPFGAASNNNGRMGKVTAAGDLITLSGKLEWLNLMFEGQFKVVATGGTTKAVNDANGDNGTIVVANADAATIIVALGTNYKLESHVFTEGNNYKKLTDTLPPHNKVATIISDAVHKSYPQLLSNHIKDFQHLFARVQLDLNSVPSRLPTDALLKNYQQGIIDPYLEELYFQYGRYLLICSSRPGTLPPNLQGIWNQYDVAPWTGGYWHNINIQMNYWPAFNTNLTDLFGSFADYNLAYRDAASKGATQYIKTNNPAMLSPNGDNGWTIGTGASAYNISSPGGHSGPGTGAMTTKLFWDYYDFTGDKKFLKNIGYPAILGMSKFLSKVVKDTAGLLLASPSYSPEQRSMVDKLHYKTVGCAFDQQMIFENHSDALKAATIIKDGNAFLATIRSQLPKLDPVQIGLSGQIKEFREEQYYGDLVLDPQHRHTSQLMGLYPGTIINSNTPAWLDAAKVSLNKRGDKSTGWAMALRLNLWARIKDGDRAYQLYQTLLQKGTTNNLWDIHPPFQIDGNFGGTAGVAEMLLQSHEGFIDLLPAMPTQWRSGSYKGLLARGNFEVAAKWENGHATSFTIYSKIGGTCRLKYFNIQMADVKNASGNKIKVASDKPDLIAFETKPGQVFTITAIPLYQPVAPPTNLVITGSLGNTINIHWSKSPAAVSYNVYNHVGDSPNYQLVQQKLTDTTFDCKVPDMLQWPFGIIRVTAVGKTGRESSGVTVLYPQASTKDQ